MAKSKWVKKLARHSADVFRISAQPEGDGDVGPSFAVRDPGLFGAARTRASKGWQQYKNENITIRFRQDGRPFSKDNLSVSWTNEGAAHAWAPGMKDAENLGGSYLSLDIVGGGLLGEERRPYDPMKGFDWHNASVHALADLLKAAVREKVKDPNDDKQWWAEFHRLTSGLPPKVFKDWPTKVRAEWEIIRRTPPGFLSRSGLTILRDDSLPWDAEEKWICPRPERAAETLYIVHYGRDYKAGIGRMMGLLGPVPRPEDWILGVWFSCYRPMGERHYRQLAKDFEKHDLPLDAIVVDTDWHKYFWHGFDFNKRLFPDPPRFTKWMRSKGLHGIYNVHPQYIPEKDTRLPEFLEKAGVEADILTRETAPTWFHDKCHSVDLFDKKQARLYFEIFHKPIEKDGGCDMWWVDGTLKDNTKRDATAWLNELYSTEAHTRGQSPARQRIVLSRAFGLGAHRSTLHFTGDTFSQWKVLEAEVRLTPMAANSLLAFVSHDIGGFFKGSPGMEKNKPADDLMARWTQFGCLSPVMRFHSDHGVREPWRFGKQALDHAGVSAIA